MNKKDVEDLMLRFLNETRPDELTVKRVNLVLNLGVESLLAYIYEEGFEAGKRRMRLSEANQ